MTTMARRDPADKAKIDAIEKKLLANPEIAKLIDDLGTSTTDANGPVRGMLQRPSELKFWVGRGEVSFVLFLGIYPIFYCFPRLILFPQRVFNLDRGSVSQALVEPFLIPP